ncbi:MAG: hypothetical protein IPG09_18275 [Ignavibacteria bacterium]|nr:hypothetical protein [Ignavibacteria bacterium]
MSGIIAGIVNMIHNTVHLQGGNLNGYSTCAGLEYNGNTYFEKVIFYK